MFSFVTIECEVFGSSMYPTLNYSDKKLHDTVFVNVCDKDVVYGDIVVIETNTEKIIKRVIGVSGDKIDIVLVENQYLLERNGEIIREDYINENVDVSEPAKSQNGMDVSFDNFTQLRKSQSENFESVDENGLGVGKYVVPENSIFVMGDNRKVSEDSTKNGAFDISRLVGKVELTKKYDESLFAFYYHYIFEGKFFQTIENCL